MGMGLMLGNSPSPFLCCSDSILSPAGACKSMFDEKEQEKMGGRRKTDRRDEEGEKDRRKEENGRTRRGKRKKDRRKEEN